MKKQLTAHSSQLTAPLKLAFVLILLTAPVAATVTINTLENTELIITPIKTTHGFESLEESESYFSGDLGRIKVDYPYEEFDLAIKVNTKPPYYAELRQSFEEGKDAEMSLFPPEDQYSPIEIPKINMDNIPEVVVTGYATYEKNKEIIVPIYYSLLGILAIILFVALSFNKGKRKDLIKEADDLLAHDKLAKAKDEFIEAKTELTEAKEKMEDIPKIEEESTDPEVKAKVKEEESEDSKNEVFKKEEEKLEEEVKEEAQKSEIGNRISDIGLAGQPIPVNEEPGKKEISNEKLEEKAEKLEKE